MLRRMNWFRERMVTDKEYMVDSMPGGIDLLTMIMAGKKKKPLSKTAAMPPPKKYKATSGMPS